MTAQQIYNNNELYRYLILYFYEDLSEPSIDNVIMESKDQRLTICVFFEEWIPWDKKLPQILEKSRPNSKGSQNP